MAENTETLPVLVEFDEERILADALPGETNLTRSAIVYDLGQSKQSLAYKAREPIVMPHSPVYPLLLSGEDELQLSREDLLAELLLVLEMNSIPNEGISIYSVRIIQPASFDPPKDLVDAVEKQPAEISMDVKAGYMLHELLGALRANEAAFSPLARTFLDSATRVEVKLRSAPSAQRLVQVDLLD